MKIIKFIFSLFIPSVLGAIVGIIDGGFIPNNEIICIKIALLISWIVLCSIADDIQQIGGVE